MKEIDERKWFSERKEEAVFGLRPAVFTGS